MRRCVNLIGLTFVGLLGAQEPISGDMPKGARLYVAPMEWNLDRFVAAEIRSQGVPVQLVTDPEEADFVMTGVYQALGSHRMSPGHYIQVRIVAVDNGKQMWSAEANDYSLFFGRLRPHGPAKAARTIVKKLHQVPKSGR